MSAPPTTRRAGRPPKHPSGTLTMRWWLYVNPTARRAAEDRAAREGRELPDVMRACLDAYAAGTDDTDPREEATELLPWIPQDDDGLAYRQGAIAEALTAAYARGLVDARATR